MLCAKFEPFLQGKLDLAKLDPLEFKILKAFGDRFRGQKFLLACSGGRDSVALVRLLNRLRSRAGFDFEVAYVHHGISKSKKTSVYRNEAARFVESLCSSEGLKFHRLQVASELELVSEAELRKARLMLLSKQQENSSLDRVVFAHHADDLLETRLIRLIRGTSAHGLRSMREWDAKTTRPFLAVSAGEIVDYVSRNKIAFLEDPSNSDQKILRNWIRRKWLPDLEKMRSGSSAAIARSLESIAESLSQTETGLHEFDRKEFESLSPAIRRNKVAAAMRSAGQNEFSAKQIEEVVKRLSSFQRTKRRQGGFSVSHTNWAVGPTQITVRLAQDPISHAIPENSSLASAQPPC
jgi:tRNA(Ile)-lysidine synthase